MAQRERDASDRLFLIFSIAGMCAVALAFAALIVGMVLDAMGLI